MEVVKNERNGNAVINDLTVRFVRNNIDAGGKFLFLFGQHLFHLGKQLCRIDNTGWNCLVYSE